MLIFRFIISFWVTSRIFLQAMILSFLVQCFNSEFPLCLNRSVLAPFSLRHTPLNTQSALIGQLAHA